MGHVVGSAHILGHQAQREAVGERQQRLGRLTRRSAFMAGPEASILLPLMEWWPNAMSGTLQKATEMGARSSSLYGQYVKPIKIFIDDEQKEFLFQEDIAPFLRSLGYAYSTSQINKLCAPAVNEGPPIALWHGPRPLRTPDDVIAWAEKRFQARMTIFKRK